jgi:hypothetical protein
MNLTQEQETNLVKIKLVCDAHPHPYNAMIFGMWMEEYGFPKTSNPFDGKNNHPLYLWFSDGWQANRDSKIMNGKAMSEERRKQEEKKKRGIFGGKK